MKNLLMQQLITVALSLLSPEMLKKAVDLILDVIEEAVEKSETKVDDAIVLPLCETIRATFGVPDDD